MESDLRADANMSANPIVGQMQSRRWQQSAHWVTAILFLGMFLDYGSGFGIKYATGLLAMGWVLLNRRSLFIWHRHRLDFVVVLGIPILLGVFHLLVTLFTSPSNDIDLMGYAGKFYYTLSSPVLLLLLPLFYVARSQTVIRQIGIGFRLVAVTLLILFALHILGIVSVYQYAEVARTYELGFFGGDPRLESLTTKQSVVLAPRVAFAMPLIFGYELATSAVGAGILFLALLVVGSRGLIYGVILLYGAWLWFSLGTSRLKKFLPRLGLLMILLLLVIGLSEPIRFRITDVLWVRSASMFRGEDLSTLDRIGHLDGYWQMIQNEPWKFFLGAGPSGYIVNSFTGARLNVVEISLLNVAIYYGALYALLYAFWLYRGAWRLWRLRRVPGFQKSDLGLVLGAVVFFITGNTNPQMTSPFAIMAYMLLAVRVAEIKQSSSSFATTGSKTIQPSATSVKGNVEMKS